MREILFRGKRIDNGEWVAGYFVNLWMIHYKKHEPLITDALTGHSFAVDIDTVGQYTGLTDKNGKKIFEGDILTIQNDTPFEMTGQIIFEDGCFQLRDPSCDMYECLWYKPKEMEVIGNIHDNPELLEGGAEDGNK